MNFLPRPITTSTFKYENNIKIACFRTLTTPQPPQSLLPPKLNPLIAKVEVRKRPRYEPTVSYTHQIRDVSVRSSWAMVLIVDLKTHTQLNFYLL